MPVIQNPDAGEIIRRQAGLTLAEGYPQQLASTVQPVMDMTPRLHRVISISRGNSVTSTSSVSIYTTPTDRDFYLTNASLSIIKDSACDLASGRYVISVIIGGVSQNLIGLCILTLTGQEHATQLTFDVPVKIDRGTAISLSSASFTVGSFVRAGFIQGYEVA